MAGQKKLPFNPGMLRWARERAGITIPEAASRAGVKDSAVEAWELQGAERAPTVRQARLLADFYERQFLEFFRREPPPQPEPTVVPDFRLSRDADPEHQRQRLIDFQVWAEAQRISALDLCAEVGEEPPQIPQEIFTTIDSDAESHANAVREAIGPTFRAQTNLKERERYKFPAILRQHMEPLGVLTIRRSDLGSMGVRGLCLAEFPLPVIVFGNEPPGAQAFTLCHEFAHICIRQSAISGKLTKQGGSAVARRVEEWCDTFAGAFLMPAAAMREILPVPARPAPSISDQDLARLALMFGVSAHALLVRLVQLRYVASAYYWDVKRPEFLAAEAQFKQIMRSKYYGSRYRASLGELYTSLVIDAWSSGRITNHQAAEFMGIKNLAHLQDIREHKEM